MLDRPLSDKGRELRKQRRPVVPHVEELYSLYKTLIEVRAERGTIDFETVETQIIFGRNRKIDQIIPAHRNDAHKIIEECMLCANVCAARFLEKHDLPGLYRVHEGPTLEKKLNLNSFLGSLGFSVPSGKITPRDIQELLSKVKDRPDFHVIQTIVLRSMSQAVYTGDNQGHFGLAFPAYAHFTSPIRRYPDLLVHRAIRHIIRSDVKTRHVQRVDAKPLAKKSIYPYEAGDIHTLGEHCSATERRADLATRDAMDWLKCDYMQQHLGQAFSGIVSAVTGFGLFVELKDVYVEGLVHVTSLPDDYYHYDNVHQCMRGERTGRVFGLGDELEIIVSRVNLDDKKIDFELVSTLRKGKRKQDAKKPSSKKSSDGAPFGDRFKSAAAKAKLLREAKAARDAAEGKLEEESSDSRPGKPKRKPGKKRKPTKTEKKKVAARQKRAKAGTTAGRTKPKTKVGNKPAKTSGKKPRKRKAT